jgi:hypothetical protein
MRPCVAGTTRDLVFAAVRSGSRAWRDAALKWTSVRAKAPGRSGLAQLVTGCALALMAQAVCCISAEGASITVNGVTFSDQLGGFILEKATGEGTLDDPFVLVERMTDPNGGTLSYIVPPEFGNHIGSQHHIGFALVKVIENATDIPWTSFELELQSILGTPSDYFDGLSFGQGSHAGRPFSADGFSQLTALDEPNDRIELDHGKIPIGGRVTVRFVITEFDPLIEAYLLQRPGRPVASEPTKSGRRMLASR